MTTTTMCPSLVNLYPYPYWRFCGVVLPLTSRFTQCIDFKLFLLVVRCCYLAYATFSFSFCFFLNSQFTGDVRTRLLTVWLTDFDACWNCTILHFNGLRNNSIAAGTYLCVSCARSMLIPRIALTMTTIRWWSMIFDCGGLLRYEKYAKRMCKQLERFNLIWNIDWLLWSNEFKLFDSSTTTKNDYK